MLMALPDSLDHGWFVLRANRAKSQGVVKTREVIGTALSSKVIIGIIHIPNYPSVFNTRNVLTIFFDI